MKKILAVLALGVLAQCAAAPSSSAITQRQLSMPTNEFQVNTYTTGNQDYPTIAALPGGGFIITWESYGQDGSGAGAYAQRYDSSGNAVGPEFRANTQTSDAQFRAAVASFSDGSFVITWASDDQDGSGYGIYAQRYDASGNTVGSEFQVNSHTNLEQSDPAIATFSDDGFVITWHSDAQDGSSHGIYAQRYDASGNTVGSEFQVNTHTTSLQAYPRVASFSDNGFIITWHSDGNDGDLYGVFAQRFDSSGNTVGTEFQVNTYINSYQYYSDVDVASDDSFIITWYSDGQDGSGLGVVAQRYDSSGNTVGAEFIVNTNTASDQKDPYVAFAADVNDGFIILWESNTHDGSNYGIFARRYDSAGVATGPEFQVNTYTAGNQFMPYVAALSSGGWIAAWTSANDQDGSGRGIFARYIPLNDDTSTPTSVPTSLPSALPTSVPTSPTSIPTSVPSAVPTSVPTSPTSIPTTLPSSSPTLIPTNIPTSIPTSQPTAAVSEHIVVHLYDLHGDGWLDNVYLKVSHTNGSDLHLQSLHCSCKVVRIFTGDITLSLWRNRTVPGPKGDVMPYEWEALWTVGYSDGLTETDFGIVGDINTHVEIRNYALNSSQHVVDIDRHKPGNKCIPPKPKPKAPPTAMNTTESDVGNTTEPSQPDAPSPTLDVRLILKASDGESWCDDSGSTSVLACDKEHHLSTDAVLPNLVLYPRYYISRTDDNRVVASGTLREDMNEWVTSVKLLREGSYVFSVSGTYTASSGSVSWDFCGEQGGINERLHFNMVKSVCRAHYVEEVSGGLTCYESLGGVLLHNSIVEIQPANSLMFLHQFIPIMLLIGGAVLTIILLFVLVKSKQRDRKFIRLDTTEHNK